MQDSRLIENLVYTYAERIDAGDLEGVAELFRNGEIAAPAEASLVQGYDEVLRMYQNSTRIYADTGTPRTRHLTSNLIIEVNGDGASARSCFTVLQAAPDFPLQVIISGRYRDSFRKPGAAWEFNRREMYVDLYGDLSQHLLFEL